LPSSLPKICPTWVGGTGIFLVPLSWRLVGRIFLRRFPDIFYEFKIHITYRMPYYSPQRSAYLSVLHGCPVVPGYSGSHLATARAGPLPERVSRPILALPSGRSASLPWRRTMTAGFTLSVLRTSWSPLAVAEVTPSRGKRVELLGAFSWSMPSTVKRIPSPLRSSFNWLDVNLLSSFTWGTFKVVNLGRSGARCHPHKGGGGFFFGGIARSCCEGSRRCCKVLPYSKDT
jgi:hypothetical protein